VRNILDDGLPSWLTFVIAFSLVTYLPIVLGELMPKALTLDRAETLAALVARPMEMISVAPWPAVWVLQGSASVLLRPPFEIRDVVAGEGIRTAAELRALVDEAEGSGVIPRAQEELLHNVFDFADREAGDIMVPALDVDWLEARLTAEAALDRVLEAPHECSPVGHGSLDHLDGVVHVRDLLAAARRGGQTTVFQLARPVLGVPENKVLGALLRELRERKEQLAVVLGSTGRWRASLRRRTFSKSSWARSMMSSTFPTPASPVSMTGRSSCPARSRSTTSTRCSVPACPRPGSDARGSRLAFPRPPPQSRRERVARRRRDSGGEPRWPADHAASHSLTS
jgi:hypothetical protein